jgi:hypothetical protein
MALKNIFKIVALLECLPLSGDMPHAIDTVSHCVISEFYEGSIFYDIRSGDTLWSIADDCYGEMVAMEETRIDEVDFMHALIEGIANLNDIPMDNVHNIYAGQKIEIPYLTPEMCSVMEAAQDWYNIDAMNKSLGDIKPQPRPW